MLNSKMAAAFAVAGSLALAACGGTQWSTNYADVINPDVSKGWNVVAVEVTVPDTLTVSEDNAYAPNADIVWREDPFGNRHEQVDAIITNAAKRGASGLHGTRAVKLLITVQQFHALSEKARALLNNSGVHDITLTAQVVDANTNAPLSPPDLIKADLVAFVGDQAIAAEKQGLTQKVRITSHVAKVFAGWLGSGEDVRGTFIRNGR